MHAYASEDEELQQEAQMDALPHLDLLVMRIGSVLTDPPNTPTYLEPASDTTDLKQPGVIDPLQAPTPTPTPTRARTRTRTRTLTLTRTRTRTLTLTLTLTRGRPSPARSTASPRARSRSSPSAT